MQKLFRRTPGSPVLCSCGGISNNTNNSPKFLPLIGFKSLNRTIGFKTLTSTTATSPISTTMTTAAALHLRPTIGGSEIASVSPGRNPTAPFAGRQFSFASRCRVCRCSIDARVSVSGRAWVVFKESRVQSPLAWFHTDSSENKSVSVVAESSKNSEASPGNGGENEDELSSASSEERPVRPSRRQRGSLNGGRTGTSLPGNPDLLTIPGVGPKNLRKLVENGIEGVAELKKIYKDKFFGKSNQKMIEFLQSSVGIIHKNHAESITTFIRESVDEELKEDSSGSDLKPMQKKRLTICVEGNISVGKTTFLQRIANETLELRDLVEIVPEPIGKWQDIGPDHFNILDAFYAEPERYAYTFQNYVFVTRVMQEKESSVGIKPLRLMERSVFSDRMVFVRAVHEANWMNEMEISIYDSWFDPVVSSLPGLIPDGFIYLRASPDTCHKRMMLRKRSEEGGVSLDYLRGLHEKHESWLFPSEIGNHGVLSVSQPPFQLGCSLHPDIRDRVFYLEGNHMHPSIQKVPALVLDCEPNIDFSRDIEAKQQYARQVAEFFEFVKKAKEVPAKGDVSTGSSQSQVLIPPEGLWVPNSKNFPDSALKSLDFKQAMSFISG